MTDYVVIFEQAEDGGWGAYSPDVPGCIAVGDSREAAAASFREALTLHLEELQNMGQPIPMPRNVAGIVSVALPVV